MGTESPKRNSFVLSFSLPITSFYITWPLPQNSFAPSCLSFLWFQAMRASCTSPCLPYSSYFDSITNLFDFLFLQTFLSLLLDNLMIWVFLFQLKFRGVVRIFELVLCSMIPFPPLGPLSCSWVYALLRQPLSSYGLFHCGLWAIACPCSCPAIVELEVNTWVWNRLHKTCATRPSWITR